MSRKIEMFHKEVEVKVLLEVLAVFAILTFAFIGFYYLEPAITGLITVEKQFNYSDSIDLTVNESSDYIWYLGNPGNLKSVKLSGSIEDKGSAKVYVENKGSKYLIFDSDKLKEGLDGITGFSVLNETINETTINETIINTANENVNETVSLNQANQSIINEAINKTNTTITNESIEKLSINIILEYKGNSEHDVDDDGIESLTGVVDLTVEDSEFNWNVDESKLCTKWGVYSEDNEEETIVCYGSSDCCSLFGLMPARESWNEVFYSYYGLYGAALNNIISAQVIYADYNLSLENPYAEIYYSSLENLTAEYISGVIEFNYICIETCALFDFNLSSYKLIFELNNTILTVNEIKYSIIEGVNITANNPPLLIKNISNLTILKNKNYSIDLSEYFYDEDNNKLNYSYYKADNITVLIEDNTATIIPDYRFTGTRYMFFKADDSLLTEVSNVFKVEVVEEEIGVVEELEQLKAEINKPVKWIKRVSLDVERENLSVEIPSEAFNLSINKIINNEKISINKNNIKIKHEGKIKDLDDYEIDKEIEIINKKLDRIKDGIEKISLENRLNLLENIKIINVSEDDKGNKIELIINESITELIVEYETSAPIKIENRSIGNKSEDNKVIITNNLELHYENVLSYVNISESRPEQVHIYWYVNNTKIDIIKDTRFNVTLYDTNNNSLIDKVSWIVPKLSTQVFEVSVIKAIDLKLEVKDSNNSLINASVELYSDDEKLNENNGSIAEFLLNLSKKYGMVIYPSNKSVKKIVIHGIQEFNDINISFGIDDIARPNFQVGQYDLNRVYGIDPTQLNFTNATVTANAAGHALYKCKDWNFSEQDCYGSWEKVMDTIPGQEYNFTLTAADPGFGDASPDEGYPDVGTITGTWDASNLPWAVSDTNADDTAYLSAQGKRNFQLLADFSLDFDISVLVDDPTVVITGLAGSIRYCHSDTTVSACTGGNPPSALASETNDIFIINDEGTEVDVGNIPTTADNIEQSVTWTASGTMADYIRNDGFVNLTFEAMFLNDRAALNIDLANLTVTYQIDAPPAYSDIKTKPNNLSLYSSTQEAQFNISWTDSVTTVSNVTYEHNFTRTGVNENTSVETHLGSEYFYNRGPLAAGTYHWRVIANDTKGNVNSTDNLVFVINRSGSLVNVSFNATHLNRTINQSIHVNITGALIDPPNGLVSLYKNGSLIGQGQSPFEINYIFNDTQYFNISAAFYETENYTASLSTLFITVNDSIAPVMTLFSPEDNSFNNNGSLKYIFNVTDNSSITQCQLFYVGVGFAIKTGNDVDKELTQSFTDTANDGPINWFVNCTDINNYVGKSDTLLLTVDKTPPKVTLNSPKNNTWDNDGALQMNFSVDDTNANTCIFYTNFSGVWKANQSNSTVADDLDTLFNETIVPDGSYNWSVFCNDSAGNIDWGGSSKTVNESFIINVDTQIPKLNFTGPTPSNDTNTTLTTLIVNVTLEENNTERIVFNFNGTDIRIKTYDSPDGPDNYSNETYTNLQGIYYFNATINDSAGQINKTETRIVRVDNTPPKLYLESPIGTSYDNDGFVAFKYNASDETLGVKNCSIFIDGILNITNKTVTESISQNFTKNLLNGTYNWSINCKDYVNNTNTSETRNITIDTTIPFFRNESINISYPFEISVGKQVCLYVILNDTFSDINPNLAKIKVRKPDGTFVEESLSNLSTDCAGGGWNWSTEFTNSWSGEYVWNITNVSDMAGNINASTPYIKVNWSATTNYFLNTTMIEPLINFEINESDTAINYSFSMTCNVTCRPDSDDDCENVVLMAEYNNATFPPIDPLEWYPITNETTQLINDRANLTCETLSEVITDENHYCNQTFNISTGLTSGNNNFSLRCNAISSNAEITLPDLFVNMTVNDHPAAAFTFPSNGSFLNGIEILNASASTDDQNLTRYVFELDDNSAFSSPTILCDNNQSNCTFNTITQHGVTQCAEDTWDCYIRLNVTDSDDLKNSTIIQVQIDNTRPAVILNASANNTWRSTASADFNYTAFDTNLDYCTLYHNESGTWKANETNSTVANNTMDVFTINLTDGNFIWNVWCNDSAGNNMFNDTNFTVNIDTIFPKINFSGGTEQNNTYFARDYIFVNATVNDSNFANMTFYLYNSSFDLVNTTDYTAVNQSGQSGTANTSINFTNLADADEIYYYNATVRDKAGNENYTETRVITLDNTAPEVGFSIPTESNNTFFNRNYILVNISINETNFANATFYLYNSIFDLVNETNVTSGVSGTANLSVNFSNLADLNEMYYYNVTVRDKVEFENYTITRVITLDNTTPAVRLEEPINKTFTANNNITFNFTAFDTYLKNCTLYANFSGTFKANVTNTSPSSGVKTQFSPTTTGDGFFVWNVLCYDNASNNAFNNTNFTIEIDATPPSDFRLDLPANNTPSKNRTPFLNWTIPTEQHFDNYTLFFDTDEDFALPIDFIFSTIGNSSNNSFTIPDASPLADNTLYYWKVIAYDNLSQSTDANETFIYITDNRLPRINLSAPSNHTEQTLSSSVNFQYNASDENDVANCSLVLNDKIDGAVDSSITEDVIETFSRGLQNGLYNWSINCTDSAGNVNSSETRNLSINVGIPVLRYYQTDLDSDATISSLLRFTEFGTANIVSNTLSQGTSAQFGEAINTSLGQKGIYIPAGSTATFSAEVLQAKAPGYVSWELFMTNDTEYTITTFGDIGLGGHAIVGTGSFYTAVDASVISSDFYIGPDDELRLIVHIYSNAGGNTNFQHRWDNALSYVQFNAYRLGDLQVNISSPLLDYTVNQTKSFNATCNVSCSDGYCINAEVTIQQNTSTSAWSDIDAVSGNLILDESLNPQSIGIVNETQLINFTLQGNEISTDTNIKCIAASDYSSINGTNSTAVTVRDEDFPSIELNNPVNNSFENKSIVFFEYTPNDNYNVSNCSIIINNKMNITNRSISETIRNNFTIITFEEKSYNWSVNCTDNFNNVNSSITRLFTVDTIFPKINFSGGTEANNTYFARNYIFVNVTVNESNFANMTFYLYNSSFDLVNTTDYTAVNQSGQSGTANTSINFTNLADKDEIYYYNATVWDKANNKNSTETRVIILDNTAPEAGFAIPTENNNTFFNRNYILVNVSINESNFANATFYLYNPSFDLINETNVSSGLATLNLSVNFSNLADLDEQYYYNVTVRDKVGFENSTLTRVIILDNKFPRVNFTKPTESNNTFFNRNYIFVNVTINESNFANATFYLYNSIYDLVNETNVSSALNTTNLSINFSNLADLNEIYYYNVTVRDKVGFENHTMTRVITLDNTTPAAGLSSPSNNTWDTDGAVQMSYTPSDTNVDTCILYTNFSGAWKANQSNDSVVNNLQGTFNETAVSDGNFIWNVYCNDSAGNSAFNNTNFTINVDTVFPKINYSGGTENNNTFFARDFIFVNVSVNESNFANMTFYLYNSSFDLVNNKTYTAVNQSGVGTGTTNTSINFTNLADEDEVYYYNATIVDKANNENSTETRVITLDNTVPEVGFSAPTEENNTYFNRDFIYVNVSINESNFANATFYLYNSVLTLVNETNITSGDNPTNLSVNFTKLADLNEKYYYNVTIRDKVGFENSTLTRVITLDDINSSVKLDAPANNTWDFDGTVQMSYTLTDANPQTCILYTNFSDVWKANQSNSSLVSGLQDTFNATEVEEGNFIWNVWCNDSAGNSAFNNTNFTINIDTIIPKMNFSGGTEENNTFFARDYISVNVSLSESNFANMTFYLYNSNFDLVNATNYTAIKQTGATNTSINFTNLADKDGVYYYNATVWDKANNENSTETRVITLDNTNPQINFTGPTPPNNTNQTSKTVFINVSHFDINNDSVALNFNGTVYRKKISVNHTNFTVETLGDGTYFYNVTINDSAGNINITETRIVRIDNTSPQINLETPINDTWINNNTNPVLFEYNANDETLTVQNCSLIINGLLNQTNHSITEGITNNFTQLFESGDYNWSVNCADPLNNINYSGDRSIKVDLSFPTILNESKNTTVLNITSYICLNVTVLDTFSGFNTTYARIRDPDGIFTNVFFSDTGTGSCGDAAGNNIYWAEYQADKVGQYNWTQTFANDSASNLNSTITGLTFNSSSIATLTVNTTYPILNFEINESESWLNYTYRQECKAACNPNNGAQNCTNVSLYAQYNLSGAAADITTGSQYLVNFNDSVFCGNLSESNQSDVCAYNFTIRTSVDAGRTAWKINCRAGSNLIGTYTSEENINLTVNDHPNASFTYPKNGTWLHGIEILNGSASTDDQNITRFIFELDDNILFSSPSLLCDNNQSNCTFNTLTQEQCENETFNCFLRLNVTDNDGLNNGTVRTMGIDNKPPRINLDEPLNNTWSSSSTINFRYTPTDVNLAVCILYHNETGTFEKNETNSTFTELASGVQDTFTIDLLDGSFIWNVFCNDTETNSAFNDTNLTINVDAAFPKINYSGGTENNNTFFARDFIFVNVSVNESNFANMTFYLYNSSFDLVNNKTYTAVNQTETTNTSINFTNLADIDEQYYYNITIVDKANNENSTETRVITLDNTNPKINFSDSTPANNTNQTSTTLLINVTNNETNPDSAILDFNGTLYTKKITVDYTNFTLTNLEDGEYWYNVSINDSAGNTNLTETRIIRIDTTPPKVELERPLNNTWNIGNLSFYYNASEQLLTVKNCSLIINNKVNQTNYTITEDSSQNFTVYNFADRFYNWSVNCSDALNNINSSETWLIKLDSTPPNATLDRPQNLTNISANIYVINATVVDSGIGVNATLFEYRENNEQAFQEICTDEDGSDSYSCSWNLNALPDGNQYQIRVRANDSLGTWGEYDMHYNITIDRVSPNVTILSPSNNTRDLDGNILFRYNVTDVTSNIVNCSLIIDNRVNQTNHTVIRNQTNNFSVTNFAEAQYNWSVNCTDTAGNTNYSAVFNISVNADRDPPIISLILPRNDSTSTTEDITFSYNVTDELSKIANCSLFINHTLNKTDEIVTKNITQTFPTVNDFNDGDYIWQVNCTDNSSGFFNIGASDVFNLTVAKTTNFIVSVSTDRDDYERNESVQITTNVTDALNTKIDAIINTDIIYVNTTNVTVLWWNASYTYRQRINISNANDFSNNYSRILPANYTINHTINTADLISNGKMLANGDDLRIAFWNNETGNWAELDRLVFGINEDETSVWFKTQEQININESDLRYYAYYSNDSAANPPENKSKVYFYYESFDSDTTSLYNLAKDFEDLTEDNDNIIEYDSLEKWLNHSSNSNFGKSIRRSMAVDDAIVEVYHYYSTSIGISNRLEIASRINGDSYYYFYTSDNVDKTRLKKRIDGGPPTVLDSSYDTITTQDQWYRLTLETYSNDSTVFVKAYVDGILSLSHNDTDTTTARITDAGGFGAGEFQIVGRWDNISVRRKVLAEPTTKNNVEEEWIGRLNGSTGGDGSLTLGFSTTNKQFGNYSAVSLAQHPNYFNGYGSKTFELGPDITPPTITLNYPVNDFNSTEDIINFNWTADDRVDTNLTCNVTINNKVNGTNISSFDEQPTNFTVAGLAEGANFWNVTCIDDANNTNISITRNFTIIKGPAILNATLANDNETILLDWNDVSYAESYRIYIIDNFAENFQATANVSGLTDSNYTDTNAANKTQRFYKIAAIKGSANKTTIKTVGKYEFELINNSNAVTDWNLISLPLNITNFELNNGSNNGYDLRVRPLYCIKALWFYNATIDQFMETEYNGTAWIPVAGSENFTSLEVGRGYWTEVNQTCNLTIVGEVPASNATINFDIPSGQSAGWNLVGWYSPNSSNLPQTSAASGWAMPEPPYYPVNVNPTGAVRAIDRYNPITDKFEVTIHFTDNWGWWPSWNNQDFTTLDPTKGYYLDVAQVSTWEHKPNTEKD